MSERAPAEQGSVSLWIERAKGGDEAAIQALWERYYEGLVRIADREFPRTAHADPEDFVLSTFQSFWQAARAGRFPVLMDREGLWRLLLVMSRRKAIDASRRAGRALPESDLFGACAGGDESGLVQIVSREPTPEQAALVVEGYQRLLAVLAQGRDPVEAQDLRAVAVLKMEGHTAEEIARKLGIAPRTVFRQLSLIRKKLERELGPWDAGQRPEAAETP
jgi:RNA polymerase sigma factor (sigma-70 family)